MNKKNVFFQENVTEMQYFCHLQVSDRFRRTADYPERELMAWIARCIAHRTASPDEVWKVHDELVHRIQEINEVRRPDEPFLVLTFKPLRPMENGWIRIERSAGRHQSLLLPIIDCRGTVCLQ